MRSSIDPLRPDLARILPRDELLAGGRRRGFAALCALILGVLVALATVPRALRAQLHLSPGIQDYIQSLEDPKREEWQKPDEVIEKLELKAGQAAADLGAGSGYFTVRLARAVGPGGKVFAVDIEPEMLEYVADRANREGLKNIETVQAEPHDPKLAPASVDLIFICDTLHHISNRATYYPLLVRALKPGGRLVDVDFEKRPLPFGPPLAMRIAKQGVMDEVKPAGFRLAKEYDFLPYQYFLIFER